MDIYSIYWTDEYGAYCVCPDCHNIEYLLSEDADGRQEWRCESCWHVHNEEGRYVRRWHRQGLEQTVCPECGDSRIDKDQYDGCYYCCNCQSAFRESVTETSHDEEGQPSGFRVTDIGPVDPPETCPNCHNPLRAQYFETPTGNVWAYPCKTCGIVYRSNADDKLKIPPRCPKCGEYSLFTYTDRSGERYQECEFCRVQFGMDGDYLHEEDRPKEGNRLSGDYSLGNTVAQTAKEGE